ncbi:TPA: sugar phosphate isomerase/epimerase [Candidatus Poribacteria bacterium]|nr:sugar phosphate isomerase/epimerase [Candidatus Poribacteria bacterium]
MWKTCLGTNGFIAQQLYGYDYSLEEVLNHAQEMEYDGIEVHSRFDPFPNQVDEVAVAAYAEKITSRDMNVAGIQARITEGKIFSDQVGERKAWSQSAIGQVEFCHKLGGVQCGFWPASRQPDLPDRVLVSRLSEALMPVAERAEQLNIMMTIEPEPVQIDYSYEIAAQIVDAVGSSNFRFIYDCAHAEVMVGDALEAATQFGPYIGHVHFCDSDGTVRSQEGASQTSTHLAAGDGMLDLSAILKALHQTGYDRWLQVDVWENPDPIDCSRRTKLFVDSVLSTF